MKNFIKFLFLIVLICSKSVLQSQPEKALINLGNAIKSPNSSGKLFYIAIPPNDVESYPTQSLDIFISSAFDTKVTFINENNTIYITKLVKKNVITTFSNAEGELEWFRDEMRVSQETQNQGIRIESDDPISVYVMNSKLYTTDGYLAIPVDKWGKRYIHLSFWDFNEAGTWAGGFLILAAEDNTKVTIELKGRGANFSSTDKGTKIGKKLNVTLSKGQVYMVRGKADTRGIFDLSGSEVNSDKNIGLISFHERCTIPVTTVTNGRDHLSEMIPPVDTWGLKYRALEFDRKSNMGDYFRVIASEPNTKVIVKWYDKITKQILGNDTRILQNAGDFEEYNDVQATYPHVSASVRGVSTYEFNKP